MKLQTCLLIGTVYLLLSPLQTLIADNKENQYSKDGRSISFFLKQDGNIIYLYTTHELTELHIELLDMEGNTLHTEFITLPANTTYPVYIESLPENNSYNMVIWEDGKEKTRYSIYK